MSGVSRKNNFFRIKSSHSGSALGTDVGTKTDEFLEKFQTAFDPLSFSENHDAFFFANVMLKKPSLKVKNLQNYFFELKMTPLPPAFAIFPEIHQLW